MTCVFCLDRITENNKIHLDHCHHELHSTCFTEYVKYQVKISNREILCPICRDLIFTLPEPPEQTHAVVAVTLSSNILHRADLERIDTRTKYCCFFWPLFAMGMIITASLTWEHFHA